MSSITSFLPIIASSGPSMAIPAPYWLLTVLQWLTFTLHLLAMNMLFGLVLIVLIARNSVFVQLMWDSVIRMFPMVMAATITLGVAPLLFTQVIYGEYFYAASIVSGWNWFLQIPMVMFVYYLLYVVALKKNLTDKTRRTLLIFATIGFVYISYTFTMISDLAEKPHLWGTLYQASPAGESLNPSHLETIFRWAHIITGGVAVAGLIIQLFALFHPKVKGDRDLLSFGGRIFILAVLKSSILGLIYLFLLDRLILAKFLHSPGLHVILTAIVLNIIAVVTTYKSSTSANPRKMVLTSSVLVFLSVFLMVMSRHYLRLTFLDGQFSPETLTIHPQWGAFAMFLITFLIGLAVLYWMLRRYFSTPQEAQ